MQGQRERETASTTICIRELPLDVRDRELRNFVSFLPAFQDCSLVGLGNPTKPPVGFVKFQDTASATDAMNLLSGYIFDDAIPGRPLMVEMARRDLEVRPKRPGGPRQPAYGQQQYVQSAYGSQSQYGRAGAAPYDQLGSYAPPGLMQMGAYGSYATAAVQQPYGAMAPTVRKRTRYDVGADTNSGDTLCILKMPPMATEDMVSELVQQYPGYRAMNFVTNQMGPTAFVLFEDGEHAAAALSSLHGRTICDVPVVVEVARRSLKMDGSLN